MQKSLKLKMEAQGRYLERMTKGKHSNMINKASCTTTNPSKSNDRSISMPSLCEESSDQSKRKECESDSEAEKTEIQSHEEGTFRAPKRLMVEENDSILSPILKYAPLDHSEFYGQSLVFLPEGDFNFHWNKVEVFPSLEVPSFL